MKIFLLAFDTDQLFYSGSYPLTVVKVFKYSGFAPYHQLYNDLFNNKRYDVCNLFDSWFDDEEINVPSHIFEKIKGNRHRSIRRKFFSYYRKREEEFFSDLDKTWKIRGTTISYTFVSDVHKILSIIGTCNEECLETNDEKFDADNYEDDRYQ
jgi:hypothetical protein